MDEVLDQADGTCTPRKRSSLRSPRKILCNDSKFLTAFDRDAECQLKVRRTLVRDFACASLENLVTSDDLRVAAVPDLSPS